MPRLRGAIPSPRHRLAGAIPHRIVGATLSQVFWKATQLGMYLNDVDGDCVTAEEADAKACVPGVVITDETVLAWATAGGFLNGADLISVIDAMQTGGFVQDGQTYDDGPPISVDWTNEAVLNNALSIGPLKIGVAADQLEAAVDANNDLSGWFATGFTADPNEDHCTGLRGFGSFAYLADQISAAYGVEATVPSSLDPTTPGWAMFTWKSLGVIDWPSLQAICAECWLRNPVTIVR